MDRDKARADSSFTLSRSVSTSLLFSLGAALFNSDPVYQDSPFIFSSWALAIGRLRWQVQFQESLTAQMALCSGVATIL